MPLFEKVEQKTHLSREQLFSPGHKVKPALYFVDVIFLRVGLPGLRPAHTQPGFVNSGQINMLVLNAITHIVVDVGKTRSTKRRRPMQIFRFAGQFFDRRRHHARFNPVTFALFRQIAHIGSRHALIQVDNAGHGLVRASHKGGKEHPLGHFEALVCNRGAIAWPALNKVPGEFRLAIVKAVPQADFAGKVKGQNFIRQTG